jgi:predicted ester cyclase
MSTEENKAIVRRLIEEVINEGHLEATDELFSAQMAEAARDWVGAFRTSFPDVRMKTVELLAESNTVVGRFKCSGTHLGEWREHPPSGRRFEDVDEVYFFRLQGGRIVDSWGIEDTVSRLDQLGLSD